MLNHHRCVPCFLASDIWTLIICSFVFEFSLFQDEIERADADQAQRRQREEILAREERAEQVCVVFV